MYGWYYVVKPCGYIYYEAPLYRSEGVSRTIDILNEAFPPTHYTPEEKPVYIWCDKACSVWYKILNTPDLRGAWLYTKILVDRFHGGISHKSTNSVVSQFCSLYCDVSKMEPHRIKRVLRYHGLLDNENKNLGNSEAQEQTMNKVGQLSHAVMNMDYQNQRFFFILVIY